MKGHLSQNKQFGSEMVKYCHACLCSSSILLCIMGELVGGGSVAVAVGVSDMRQVTGDT